MELFETCTVCNRVCRVDKTLRGTFLAILQRCPHCQFRRQWRSQPIIGHSTPAGNLQLSAAIYFSGASFFKVQKVCKNNCICYLDVATVRKWAINKEWITYKAWQLMLLYCFLCISCSRPWSCSYTLTSSLENTAATSLSQLWYTNRWQTRMPFWSGSAEKGMWFLVLIWGLTHQVICRLFVHFMWPHEL